MDTERAAVEEGKTAGTRAYKIENARHYLPVAAVMSFGRVNPGLFMQQTEAAISIIVPVLNEESMLPKTLQSCLRGRHTEIIVADGGSRDRTVEIARRHGAIVLSSPCGKAAQMNRAAGQASGEILLFLHADTRLPQGFDVEVRRILSRPKVVAGAFRLQIDGSERSLRIIEKGANWRARLLKLPYGDQAIFLRSDCFHRIGGYKEMPLMEDFDLVRRLSRKGRVLISRQAVLTSARRWRHFGPWRCAFMNQFIVLNYLLGISPQKLANWYRKGISAGINTRVDGSDRYNALSMKEQERVKALERSR